MRARSFAVGSILLAFACTKPPSEPKPDEQTPGPAEPVEQPEVTEPVRPATPDPATALAPATATASVSAPPQPPEFPEGPIPTWCTIALEAVAAEQLDSKGVCASLEDSEDCVTEDSAWITEPPTWADLWEVALLLPRGPDRFERLVLARHGIGREERREFRYADSDRSNRSTPPS